MTTCSCTVGSDRFHVGCQHLSLHNVLYKFSIHSCVYLISGTEKEHQVTHVLSMLYCAGDHVLAQVGVHDVCDA